MERRFPINLLKKIRKAAVPIALLFIAACSPITPIPLIEPARTEVVTPEIELGQAVDHMIVGSSTPFMIADAVNPDSGLIKDKTILDVEGDEDKAFYRDVILNGDQSVYIHAQYGARIYQISSWLKRFIRSSDNPNPQTFPCNPKIIDNWIGANDYRNAKSPEEINAKSQELKNLIDLELSLFPKAEIRYILNYPIDGESLENRRNFITEFLELINKDEKKVNNKYKRLSVYEFILNGLTLEGGHVRRGEMSEVYESIIFGNNRNSSMLRLR